MLPAQNPKSAGLVFVALGLLGLLFGLLLGLGVAGFGVGFVFGGEIGSELCFLLFVLRLGCQVGPLVGIIGFVVQLFAAVCVVDIAPGCAADRVIVAAKRGDGRPLPAAPPRPAGAGC